MTPLRQPNGYVAGVCEGIGVRYRIDPTLVRIVFAVVTLCGGAGMAAYLIAWGLMPKQADQPSPFEAAMNGGEDKSLGWVLGVVAFVLIFGGAMADSSILAAILISAAVLVGGYFLLEKRPPAWDPLGAAPDLWHLPEPSPRPKPKKSNAGLTIFCIAVAIVGFGYVFSHQAGPTDIKISSATDLEETIDAGFGPSTVDLSDLPPLSDAHELRIDGGIGPLDITLPANQPVNVVCDTGLGPTNCVEKRDDAARLTLVVDHGIGPVEITTPTR